MEPLSSRPMSRPANLIYAVDDAVPWRVLVLAGLQHTALILGVGISLPLLVLSKGEVDAETTRALLSMGLVALAVATVLQIQRRGLLGSGYFAPATFTAAYLPPCVSAIQQGGLPLVMGMLIFGGLLQMALAPAMKQLRAYLPPEIGGLAVVMIGIILGFLGFQLITDAREWTLKADALLAPAWLGALTMAVIIALGVWGKGGWRIYATLIGLITGSAFAFLTGTIEPLNFFHDTVDQGLAIPRPPMLVPTFDASLAPEFAVSAVACALRAMGDLLTCQRVEDTEWLRPDLKTLRGGVFADGLGTVLAAGIGSPIGTNTFSGSVGQAVATGTTARRVGYGIAAWMILLALLPGAATAFVELPKPILGGILLVASAHIVFNGFMVITSRLLDVRRILAIGLPLMLGLSYYSNPHAYQLLPDATRALLGSGLMVAIFGALLLNSLFRIGVAKSAQRACVASSLNAEQLEQWVMEQGARWGARATVMQSVANVLGELVEARSELMANDAIVEIKLSFDEFRVDLWVFYRGEAIHLGEPGDGDEEALLDADPDAVLARVRGRIIRGLATKVEAWQTDAGQQAIGVSFEH